MSSTNHIMWLYLLLDIEVLLETMSHLGIGGVFNIFIGILRVHMDFNIE